MQLLPLSLPFALCFALFSCSGGSKEDTSASETQKAGDDSTAQSDSDSGAKFISEDSADQAADFNCNPSKEDCDRYGTIDAVYFAQTHVHQADDEFFTLTASRELLLKVHMVAPDAPDSPPVKAVLSLNGQQETISLSGPDQVPAAVAKGPGVVQHNFDDSFTAVIPKEWVQSGLSIKVEGAFDVREMTDLKIGAPTRVIMTMFDVGFFAEPTLNYEEGTFAELEAQWPVSDLEVRDAPGVRFDEMVIIPRNEKPAVRVTSKQDYQDQTGIPFDGEQGAAQQWVGALSNAAGANRVSLYYVDIHGVPAGGQAGGFRGVGNAQASGILHHELGHALSLPHWGQSKDYPLKEEMFGIAAPSTPNEVHVGPTWGYDQPSATFRDPSLFDEELGKVRYRVDPMQGGGSADADDSFVLRQFSDYSVRQAQSYLERHVVVYNESLASWASWDPETSEYSKTVTNNGVKFPVERDVQVISVMAAIVASTPEVSMVYPPIGPYTAGLINLFDPQEASDRTAAAATFCPNDGCDVSLRITQGGTEKTYLLPASWDPSIAATEGAALKTKAVNLPADEGAVTKVELLLTPEAQSAGLPASPTILDTWTP